VAVRFWIADGVLELCVQDDGIGSAAIEKGIGLAGMEERLARFGGTVRAGNAPEGGFRLLASVPLSREEMVK
jgi:signal transduction histidine kinase